MPTRRCMKLCCVTTTLIFLVFSAILVTLAFTLLKPKQPEITTRPIGLKNINFLTFLPNVTLGILVTIDNRNYGSFEYEKSTAYISYRNSTVAVVPLERDTIPARAEVNITAFATLETNEIVKNPMFFSDVESGRLEMVSAATLHGKVRVMRILKIHATAYSTCDISIFVLSKDVESQCTSRIKV